MLLPNTDSQPRIEEVVALLCSENTKNSAHSSFWSNLLESERVRDFIPFPNTTPQYQLHWTHKKGKKKPQQFWIYCEESQQNYIRVEFCAPGFTWTRSSAIFRHKENADFVLIEKYEESNKDPYRCLVCNTSDDRISFSIASYYRSELEEITSTDLQIVFKIKADNEFPIHPQQGKPEVVRIHQNILHDKDLPFPFCYVGKFTFKNREEGWFRLEAALEFQGREIFTGTSDLFMFNNPRMKKKKHLSSFAPSEIKFMQVFALTPGADQDYWYDLGLQLGYGSTRCLQLLSLAPQIFTGKNNSRAQAIEFPSILHTIENGSLCGKRPAQRELSGPAKKLAANPITIQSRSFSLPAMQLSSFQAPKDRRASSRSIRRSTTTPSKMEQENCALDEFEPTTPPDVVLRSLAQCPLVAPLEEPPVSIFYQHLTPRMALEASNFFMLPCKKSISIDQLIIRIDQQQVLECKGPREGVRHLYSLDHNNVVELTDTMDLHALLSRQSNPVILVSSHDDEKLPPRLLFSSAVPLFRPQRRT